MELESTTIEVLSSDVYPDPISFGPPLERWVLWHVTGNCNLECLYCYGSFWGSSYKKSFKKGDDVPIDRLKDAATALPELGFTKVHVNGGEPLLRKDIWDFYAFLHSLGLKVWTLTNASFLTPNFEEEFCRGTLETLAISLDSVDIDYGDLVREKTSNVLANFDRIMTMRDKAGIETAIGMYVVLTRKNASSVGELLAYAADKGVEYVNMQPVFLPESHPGRFLVFEGSSIDLARGALDELRRFRGKLDTSSDAMLTLASVALPGHQGNLVAHNCFAEAGGYLYIDPTGEVLGCPAKPPGLNPSWGNIRNDSLREILRGHTDQTSPQCPHLSLDCLGMYEMAYRTDYKVGAE